MSEYLIGFNFDFKTVPPNTPFLVFDGSMNPPEGLCKYNIIFGEPITIDDHVNALLDQIMELEFVHSLTFEACMHLTIQLRLDTLNDFLGDLKKLDAFARQLRFPVDPTQNPEPAPS